jgi:hypothetical protein
VLTRKTIAKTILFIFITIGMFKNILAQAGPPGGGTGDPPCWPPSSCDPAIPINNGLFLLLIVGFILAFYFIKKNKAITI